MTSEQFELLSPAEKRVAIAKDIIKNIKSGKYSPAAGNYFTYPFLSSRCSIKDNFNKINGCEVCELGAIFLSVTQFRNLLTPKDINVSQQLNTEKINKILKGIFTPKQLFLIECAFEGNDDGIRYANEVGGDFILTEKEGDRVADFYMEFPEDEDRAIAIMQDIIDNKGTFKL